MRVSPLRLAATEAAKQIATALFREMAEMPEAHFSVRYWDGTGVSSASGSRFTLIIQDPSALAGMFLAPDELSMGELFISGKLDVEGEFEEALRFGEKLMSSPPPSGHGNALRRLAKLIPGFHSPSGGTDEVQSCGLHSRESDQAAIAHHYDVSNDFYRLWLDRDLQYTSAYFESPDEDLDVAQNRKLDYICRKLDLQPGDRLLDIGCGWGGLAIHAALHYGAEVRGITLSRQQLELARERIRDAGLEDRCAVQICDYRDVEGTEVYDKIASIGMIEHVGQCNLGIYFAGAWRLLRDGGLFLNSGISASATWKREGNSFIDRYVFPDGDLVPLNLTLRDAEAGGFEVRDVACLREHYALTLDHWVRRLEEHAGEAREAAGDVTYRIWRLYMAASAHAFRTNRINLYQVLLSKSRNQECAHPLTHRGWRQAA